MTRDERFERALTQAVRDGAPEVAPPALRQRVEGSIRFATTSAPARRASLFAAAAAVVVLLVAVAVVAPRLGPTSPGTTAFGSMATGTSTRSPAATFSPTAAIRPLAEPIHDPGQVQSGQLFSVDGGWAINTDNRVLLTHSGGSAWRDVTPPGIAADSTLNPSFLDAAHGWVGEDRADRGIVIWRTTDAGATWGHTDIPDVETSSWALLFQSTTVGWLATDPGGQRPKPELRWTEDGGSTWSAPTDLAAATGVPALPALAFADRNHGVLTADGLVRATSDGGRSWTDVALPELPAVARNPGNNLRFSLPTFVDGEHGFLTISVMDPVGAPLTKLVLATSTAGATWQLALRDDLVRSWAFIDVRTWIGMEDAHVWTTEDAGANFLVQDSAGLPTPLGNASIVFVDPAHAWAQAMRACTPGHYGCFAGPELFATSDAGQYWTRIGSCIFTCEAPRPS